MTSSANDEWSYYDLRVGVEALEKMIYLAPNNPISRQLQHTVNFILYNVGEMEITGGNGD